MVEKFFADHMLKRLSRWLRFMGYDVEYPRKDVSDNEILKICGREGRILLTRDQELYGRYARSILIRSEDFRDQVVQVAGLFPPDRKMYFTRCPECNSDLTISHDISGLPEGVMSSVTEIWVCMDCGKKYWKGSHYDRILEQIREIEEKLI